MDTWGRCAPSANTALQTGSFRRPARERAGPGLALALLLGFSGCLAQGELETIAALSGCEESPETCTLTPDGTRNLSSTTSLAGATSYRLRGATSAPFPFIEYVPGGYNDDPARKWPLIIMLHGLGEQGQGSTQADLQRAGVHGPNKRIGQGRHFPAVILTPQTPTWWDNATMNNFLTWALANYRLDDKRVYVTGLSMGGAGTWGLGGVGHARIAAIAPICGAAGADGNAAQRLLDSKVSVWAFHAQNDGTVGIGNSDGWMNAFGNRLGAPNNSVRTGNVSGSPTKTAHLTSAKAWEWRDGVQSLAANGSRYPRELHYTVYPTGGHDSWTPTYNNEEFWTWLFRQVRP